MATRFEPRTHGRRAAALTAKLGRVALAPSELLTVVTAILAAVSAAAGVFSDLYRDNDWTRAANQGNDGLTLLALIAMAAGQAAADIPHAWAFTPFSIVFLMGGGICSWLLLVNIGPSRAPSPVRGCGESAGGRVLSADARSAFSE
jgi:hypothetical protein